LIIVLGQKRLKQWRQKKKDGDKIVCGSGVIIFSYDRQDIIKYKKKCILPLIYITIKLIFLYK
jgi:hypothetical protein